MGAFYMTHTWSGSGTPFSFASWYFTSFRYIKYINISERDGGYLFCLFWFLREIGICFELLHCFFSLLVPVDFFWDLEL